MKKGDYITVAVVLVVAYVLYRAFAQPVYAANSGTVTN